MQYKITKQYARDIEVPMGEFGHLIDARFFVKVKLESDAKLHVAAIYRLYHHRELLDEINYGKINTSSFPKRYFFDDDVYRVDSDGYQVVVQDLIHSPVPQAIFIELQDAHLFIEKKLSSDSIAHKKIIYRILRNNQLVEKLSPLKVQPDTTSGKATVHTTPFKTALKSDDSLQRWINKKINVREKEEKEQVK